jgi:hypothetical protein
MNTPTFDVLHALAIKGMAQVGALAATTARTEEDLLGQLDRLRTDGLAVRLERRGLWRSTPEGRIRHAELLEIDIPAEVRARLDSGYGRFLPLNRRFKELCTRWQVRAGAPNDHSDAEYDRALLAELGTLHSEAAAVTTELAQIRQRFARYGGRLAAALTRVREGDLATFTGVMCESYHDIWMELHRDLLVSLKTDRETEEARAQSAGTVL